LPSPDMVDSLILSLVLDNIGLSNFDWKNAAGPDLTTAGGIPGLGYDSMPSAASGSW
jgi:hypothetical protein